MQCLFMSTSLRVSNPWPRCKSVDLCNNLHPMIKDFLQCEQDNSSHAVMGVQMQDSQCPLPFDHVQIWYKICVQQFLYHSGGKVDAPQTLKALPPSTKNPHGLYDAIIVSPNTESDWPLQGLEGMTTSHVDSTSNSWSSQDIPLPSFGLSSGCWTQITSLLTSSALTQSINKTTQVVSTLEQACTYCKGPPEQMEPKPEV